MKNWLFILIFLFSGTLFANELIPAKPFKRAMVISGGYLSPGVGLGLIAGARDAGFEPDVVIMTCGASMTAALYGGYGSIEQALAFARSEQHYELIKSLLRMDTRLAPMILYKIHQDSRRWGSLPQLFTGNVLNVPETLPEWMPNRYFQLTEGQPRFIVLSAKAHFGPEHVGANLRTQPSYRQVFFTDQDTAQYLLGRPSDIKKNFPNSFIDPATEVDTNASLLQAYRASISDPYYINPGRIGNTYYFTGAVDLFPIDLAKDLAEEVLVTTPSTEYAAHDVAAIYNAFGFNQQTAAIHATKHTDVTYIEPVNAPSFQPALYGPILSRGLPKNAVEFSRSVDIQYLIAYYAGFRAGERARKEAENFPILPE